MVERSPSLAERVRPAQTALVVIDMQNDFVHPDGANGAWIRARPGYRSSGARS
jgi:isochorismate hydrolase